MMKDPSLHDLTPQEYRNFILPTTAGGLGILLTFLLTLFFNAAKDIPAEKKHWLVVFIVVAALYVPIYSTRLIPAYKNREILVWLNALVSGAGFWILSLLLPQSLTVYFDLLLFLAVISNSIFAGRIPTMLLVALGILPRFVSGLDSIGSFSGWMEHIGPAVTSIMLAETTIRIQETSRAQARRLDTINEFSRQVAAAALDREQILSNLDATLHRALKSDSHYISALEGGEVNLLLCYDDGEYFNGTRVPAEGTLTNWVVQNQRELFLPDLRQPIPIEGIQTIIVGKEKNSLSWVGVPMISRSFQGVLALASYQPNAFNRSDVELLANLAQHAALALDNAQRHAEVEERSRIDSLTGVLNHGYFLQTLQRQADAARAGKLPLSLIMLDVDYFKEYNDTYGHLVGDEVLIHLCKTIRLHIKSTDAVGRWGGEEFVVSLPGANGAQARCVAERIQETMRALHLNERAGHPISPPTVSQGIAVFPLEAEEIYPLIDLADRRLYAAKNRGRDQIEPPPNPTPPPP